MQIIETKKYAQSSDLFTNQIAVDVYADGLDLDIGPIKVQVQYMIDVEYRRFGIKSIGVIPTGVIDVPLMTEAGQDFTVQVDCSQVKTEVNPGSGVWISGLTLWLVGQQVDYKRSNFDVVCGC